MKWEENKSEVAEATWVSLHRMLLAVSAAQRSKNKKVSRGEGGKVAGDKKLRRCLLSSLILFLSIRCAI
jgi:hypothetical protein